MPISDSSPISLSLSPSLSHFLYFFPRYVPGFYKIFDEILVNAADNKQRDAKMDLIKIEIKVVSSHWFGRGVGAIIGFPCFNQYSCIVFFVFLEMNPQVRQLVGWFVGRTFINFITFN